VPPDDRPGVSVANGNSLAPIISGVPTSVTACIGWTSAGPCLDPTVVSGLQGSTLAEAFVVKCGTDTMRPKDIAQGLLTIVLGYAPLKPAELISLTIPLGRP
jgi:phage tail sheath protein FI